MQMACAGLVQRGLVFQYDWCRQRNIQPDEQFALRWPWQLQVPVARLQPKPWLGHRPVLWLAVLAAELYAAQSGAAVHQHGTSQKQMYPARPQGQLPRDWFSALAGALY